MPFALFLVVLSFSPQVGGEWSLRKDLSPDLLNRPMRAFTLVADRDADGLDDLLVGTGDAVFLLSTGTGAELVRASVPAPYGGDTVNLLRLPDLDADGIEDWAISYFYPNEPVHLCSGADGSPIRDLPGYAGSLAALPDVDGDGVAEILVGAPYATGGQGYRGSTSLYSGGTGALLHQVFAERGLEDLGEAVARIPDLDGDGIDDYCAGAPQGQNYGSTSGGAALVSSATGIILRRIPAPAGNKHFGRHVAGGGDLDGDGVADLLISTEATVWAFSSLTGSSLPGFPGPSWHASVAFAGDLDGNGRSEVLVGDGRVPQVLVFRDDGILLDTILGSDPDSRFGEDVEGGAHLDHDGIPDLAVLDFLANVQGRSSGSVATYAGSDRHRIGAFDGITRKPEFGAAVAVIGDLDGDGTEDLAVGIPVAASPGMLDHGGFVILSGRDGRLLRRQDGNEAGARLGSALVAASDHDRDGLPDLLVGAPSASRGGSGAGSVLLYGSATGNLLRRWDCFEPGAGFGSSLARIGDLDGDGRAEFAAGAPYFETPNGRTGAVFVLATSWGGYHFEFLHTVAGALYGRAISAGGDADGDGIPDILIGAPYEPASRGYAEVRSGATGAILQSFTELSTSTHADDFGWSVAWLGDVDGDGRDDVAVSAPAASSSQGTDTGVVYLYSGASGVRLGLLEGTEYDELFGIQLLGLGDVDDSGRPELAVASWEWRAGSWRNQGKVGIYDLVGLRVVGEVVCPESTWIGTLAAGGELAGPGRPSLLIGSAYSNDRQGRVLQVAYDPFLELSADTFSAGAGGAVDLWLDFPVGEAGQLYTVLTSASGIGPSTLGGIPVPLALDPLLRLSATSAAAAYLPGHRGRLDAAGDRQLTMTFPPGALARFTGGSLHFAAVTANDRHHARRSSGARELRVRR